ncbi:Binding-protein-dependent transport systems inner membrane component [Devosia sp. LC5]|uniref:carbohydrate ABC transporter permease n=1 Tax=Devosia sp. LC5 TaxID=1502724 RepID=UPI0004E354BB|nr:sugar ABC transporter permease [Devosia sp. LC5]KFC69526.1 Binding-protein-dependent transport systems inner membrane component [Devosia sp. LC5]
MSEFSQSRPAAPIVRRSHGLFGIDLASPRHANKLGYLLLAPAALLILAILVYPMLLAIDLSFHDVKFATLSFGADDYTLKNYQRLFSSPEFWNAIRTTCMLLLVVTSISLCVGMGTALLVNQQFRGRSFARMLIALPWAVPEVVAVVTWVWILDASFGVLNWLLLKAGLIGGQVSWFSSPGSAFSAVTMVMVWKGYPFISIMILAGLQSIPEEFYQAAKVDGANVFQRFIWITVPCLAPVLGVTLVLTVLWVFRDFSIIYVLTGGGPVGATETLAIMTYEEAFSFFRMGYASSIGVVTLLICAVISAFLVKKTSHAIY